METIRAFIAVDIGNDIRAQLDALQLELKQAEADVRWVAADRIHLTLAFLGEIQAEQVPSLNRALDSRLADTGAFELHAVGTGFFGRAARPRVIWAGIAESPPLLELQQKTLAALLDARIPFDSKPFSPHLTLGRVKGIKGIPALMKRLDRLSSRPLGRNRIERVELIQSRLTPAGAEYSMLHAVPLVQGSII